MTAGPLSEKAILNGLKLILDPTLVDANRSMLVKKRYLDIVVVTEPMDAMGAAFRMHHYCEVRAL